MIVPLDCVRLDTQHLHQSHHHHHHHHHPNNPHHPQRGLGGASGGFPRLDNCAGHLNTYCPLLSEKVGFWYLHDRDHRHNDCTSHFFSLLNFEFCDNDPEMLLCLHHQFPSSISLYFQGDSAIQQTASEGGRQRWGWSNVQSWLSLTLNCHLQKCNSKR